MTEPVKVSERPGSDRVAMARTRNGECRPPVINAIVTGDKL